MKSIALWVILLLVGSVSWAQSLPEAPRPQNNAPAAQQPAAPSSPKEAPQNPPAPTAPDSPSSALGQAEPGQAGQKTIPTVPPSAAQPSPGSRDQLFTLSSNVNFVVVPVTVKDNSDHLVEGLLAPEFSVYEDGKKQKITFFTSDPFPLSAAVVLDLAMPEKDVNKVRKTLASLTGAFSQFDEVSVWTYGNTVQRASGFSNVEQLGNTLRRIRLDVHGRNGVPVVGGPLGSGGPYINGRPVDPSQPTVQTEIRESHVLNDAILAAAEELGKRDRTRRKVIFVISNGRELGSTASYADVLRVLLSQQIGVYAVGVQDIPLYDKLNRIRIPGLGYGDILPKYASATGGEVFTEISPNAIEDAYARLTAEARNQYTLGYTTHATPSSAYRSIEVRVHQPNLKVYARDGYYPIPRGR